MVKRPLPAELGLLVIDHIGVDADEDYHDISEADYLRTLCICNLVCKDWIHRSRLHLFRSIYIEDKAGFNTLQTTFRKTPSFRYLVRAIHVTARLGRLDKWGKEEKPPLHLALTRAEPIPRIYPQLDDAEYGIRL